MKTELIRIQSSTRETSVSFLRHKSETESQLSKLQTAVTLAIETAKSSSATTCTCTCSKSSLLEEGLIASEHDTTSIGDLTNNGC